MSHSAAPPVGRQACPDAVRGRMAVGDQAAARVAVGAASVVRLTLARPISARSVTISPTSMALAHSAAIRRPATPHGSRMATDRRATLSAYTTSSASCAAHRSDVVEGDVSLACVSFHPYR